MRTETSASRVNLATTARPRRLQSKLCEGDGIAVGVDEEGGEVGVGEVIAARIASVLARMSFRSA
jgi:hypothetical protein